jgi:hypothetical protein
MLLLKGNGKSHLQNTSINYLPGFLKDGTLFDTSIEDVAKTLETRYATCCSRQLPNTISKVKDGMIPVSLKE